MKGIILLVFITLFQCSYSAAQWTKENQIPSQDIVAFTVFNDTLLAASDSSVVFKSADGFNWDTLTVSANHIRIITLKVIDSIIYAGTFDDGIFSSADYGRSWVNSGSSLLAVAAIEKNGNDLYAATLGDGVFVFNQLSGNWIPFNDSLPFYSFNVFTMLSNAGTLLIGPGSNGTFYRFDFNIHSWHEEYYDGILHPGVQINKLINNGDTLFAVNGNRIIRSDDNGFNWMEDNTDARNGGNRSIYSGKSSYYMLTNEFAGGTWIQQRSKTAATGASWATNEEFFFTGFSYDIVEFGNKLFLGKGDGLYVKDLVIEVDAATIDTSVLQPNSAIVNVSTTFNPDSFCVTSVFGSSFFTLMNCDSVLFLPDSSFVGNDTCYYILCDNGSTVCDTGIIIVMVIPDSSLYPVADFSFECTGDDGWSSSFSMINTSSNDTAGSARWIVHQGFSEECDTITLLSGDTASASPLNTCFDTPTTVDVCLIASNQFGSDSVCKSLCSFVWEGIDEVQALFIHIYPNPVADQAIIVADDRAIGETIRFTDVTGKEIMTIKLQHKTQPLEPGKFPPGLYFVQFTGKKAIPGTFKLLIE